MSDSALDYLLVLFNLLLLLFWTRLWSAPAREFHFNPFLSGTVRLTDSACAFLRPVFGPFERLACLAILLAGVTFKALLVGRLGGSWTLELGGLYAFSAPAAAGRWGPHFLYSTLHTAAFLIRCWTVFLLVQFLSAGRRASRASEAFAFFCRPFSGLPLLAQPVALLALHAGLACALSRTGALSLLPLPDHAGGPVEASPFLTGPLAAQALKTGWLAVLSCADGLALLMRGLIVFILGNFGAALLQARGAALICHEAVELLLGRFARRQPAAGMGLDFTPLIFFFVVNLLYDSVRVGLHRLIQTPLFN